MSYIVARKNANFKRATIFLLKILVNNMGIDFNSPKL